MFPYKTLDETVREMRSLADMLIPYSFPIKSHQDEIDIACLKQRDVVVDGIEVGLLFNISDLGKYRLESLQVFGRQFTYLPFRLVSKIARSFLGDAGLSLTEVGHGKDDSARNIYVWTLYFDKAGKIVPTVHKTGVATESEGLKFNKINAQEISFF